MGSRRDHVGVRDRGGVHARRDEARDVRHVHHQNRTHLSRDLGELFERKGARVRARTRHDHVGVLAPGGLAHGIHVDTAVVLADAVVDDPVQLPAEVHRRAVGEVSAVREVHPENRVPGTQEGEVSGDVGLRPAVRLHIRVIGFEQLLGALAGETLDPVYVLAAAVIALPWIALRVLVGEHRAHRLQHCGRNEILARDELKATTLPVGFTADGLVDFRVGLGQHAFRRGARRCRGRRSVSWLAHRRSLGRGVGRFRRGTDEVSRPARPAASPVDPPLRRS